MSDDDSEKTEDATPERRRKAREEGQFPRAKDTGGVAATADQIRSGYPGAARPSGVVPFRKEEVP